MNLPTPVPPVDAAEARDLACLHSVAGGDRAAFDELYRRHHPRLARFLRRFTGRADLIDDVVNDTMWIVWRKAHEFRGGSRVGTWITGITYRCMLKALRSGAPAGEVSESALGGFDLDDTAAADPQIDHELRDWVERGLRTLPPDQRVTLELAYFMGHSCEEIAVVMGCPVGTVKARMFHARVRLRTVMPALAGQDDATAPVKNRESRP
jgi:RNA polymerase sigma-70 factor (ECF subfamily)